MVFTLRPSAHLPCLATRAGLGRITRSSNIARFVQGGVVKTFRWAVENGNDSYRIEGQTSENPRLPCWGKIGVRGPLRLSPVPEFANLVFTLPEIVASHERHLRNTCGHVASVVPPSVFVTTLGYLGVRGSSRDQRVGQVSP